LTPQEVCNELTKVAESGVSYKGDFLLNFDSDGPGVDSINSYLTEATQIGNRTPSSFSKLVTQQFIKETRKKCPKIFKNYPAFTLECIISATPRREKISSTFNVGYEVLYNLHPLDQIIHLYHRNGVEVDNSSVNKHVNLDNFIGKGYPRLTEYSLNMNKEEYSFHFEQTAYLSNPQKRLDFLISLYSNDTKPIQLMADQDYDVLNMFGIFCIKYSDLPNKNINSHETQRFIISKIEEFIDIFMLRQKRIMDRGNLKALKLIDGVETEINLLNYLTTSEIKTDSL
jgi:hypothetical protein